MSVRRYGDYRPSRQSYLGDLPAHWEVKPLKHLVTLTSGGTPSKERPEFWDGEVPWASAKDLKGEVLLDTADHVTQAAVDEGAVRIVAAGTVLVLVRGMMLARAFPVSVAGRAMAINQDLKSLAGRAAICNEYLAWLMRGTDAETLSRLDEAGHGTKALRMDAWTSMELPVPPLGEQWAIAAFLDRETAKIDALVEEQRRLLNLLTEEIAALALPSLACAQIRLSAVADVVERPVALASDQIYTPIGLFNRGRGLFHKEPCRGDEMGESDFYWVQPDDLIVSGQFAWEGAVAMASDEDAECVVSHRYHVLRGKPGRAITEYLYALFCTTHGSFLLDENSRGAAGRNRPLNIRTLLKEKLPVADLIAQERVALAVQARRRLSYSMREQIRLLSERRAALISAAVTGKIDVRDQAAVRSEVAAA